MSAGSDYFSTATRFARFGHGQILDALLKLNEQVFIVFICVTQAPGILQT
jgi:hypothetical protein